MTLRIFYPSEKGDFGCYAMGWDKLVHDLLRERLGVIPHDKYEERSQAGCRPCRCKLLRSSSLVLCNSSLTCACSSIVIKEASISAIRRAWRRSWSTRASSRSRSYYALASSRIRSCSRLYSSFASWRALMVFMICCKARASLPSDPNGPCLVFLISQNAQSQMWMRSSFIEPHARRQNVLVDWPRLDWMGELHSDLSPLGAPKCCSSGTKMTLPVDHTPTIKSVRAFKLIKFVSV